MAEVAPTTLDSGLTVSLGYTPRPFEPASVKYNYSNFARPAVDITQPRLFWGSKPDPRLPIKDQKSMGSCSSFGAANGVTAAQILYGTPHAEELMHDWLYWKARTKEGSFPTDAGSDPADILDFIKAGAPPQSAQAGGYVDNPSLAFPQYDAAATLKYVDSYHAIYPTDGPDMQTLIWQALDTGYHVVLATAWTDAMFYPTQGRLPAGQSRANARGGHCLYCYGITQGYFLCDNSWSPQWAPDAQASGFPGMRPGSCAMPWEYALPGGLLDVAWAVVAAGAPSPQPAPGRQLVANVVGPGTLQPGVSGRFVVSGTGADKPMYAIKYGDGTTGGWAVNGTFNHAYAAAGVYTVQAYLGDQTTGLMSSPAVLTVTVGAAPQPQPQPTPPAADPPVSVTTQSGKVYRVVS